MLAIYSVIVSIILIIWMASKFKADLSNFIIDKSEQMENTHSIDKKIFDLEHQIEIANKTLILLDNNIETISATLKKIIRVSHSKEEDLKKEFIKIKNEAQIKIAEKYQKQLLIETMELACSQILYDKEMNTNFIQSLPL